MGQPRRDVTLQDVAREAGVAVSTASRALANPERVSPVTRRHVKGVAQRLGYRPNRIARSFLSGRTQVLALLVPDITNPHNFELIRGAESQARAAGFTLVLGDTQENEDFEAAHIERLGSAVDGFVLAGSRSSPEVLADALRRRPVVLFNRDDAGFDCVLTDSVDGSRQVVEHLATLGHRRIAYLAGPRNAWANHQRAESLTRHAGQAGMEVVHLGPFSPTVAHGAAAADVGIASGASALVAFNDLLAIGVLQRLEHRGVRVPGDVSVVGFDDIFGADFCRPPLTTVASLPEQAGRSLVDLLLDPPREASATDPAPDRRRIVLATRLLVRDSTGPARDMTGC